jgi:hypothetical protein
LIQPAAQYRRIRVDAPVAQEGPVAANFLHAVRIALGDQDFVFARRGLRDDLSERIGDERRSPEFETLSAGPSNPTRFTAAT